MTTRAPAVLIIQTYYEEKTGRDKSSQPHLSIEEHPHSSFCAPTRLSLSPTDWDQRQGRATLQPHHSSLIVTKYFQLLQFTHPAQSHNFVSTVPHHFHFHSGPHILCLNKTGTRWRIFHFCSLPTTGMIARCLKSEILHCVHLPHLYHQHGGQTAHVGNLH